MEVGQGLTLYHRGTKKSTLAGCAVKHKQTESDVSLIPKTAITPDL